MNEEDLFRAYGRPTASRSRIAVPDPVFVAAVEGERFKANNRIEAEFWKNVRRLPGIDSCWLWSGRRNRHGYGILRLGDSNVLAHRLSWEIAHGEPIPEGALVRHTCDHTPCVRPDHLLTGTTAENMADMVARGRARYQMGVRDRRQNKTRREQEFLARRADAAARSIEFDEDCPPVLHQLSTAELSVGAGSYPQPGLHVAVMTVVRKENDGEGEPLGEENERTRETA